MISRASVLGSIAISVLAVLLVITPAPACCPAPHFGQSVVNADQTVVILWDAATKTEHFVRQASFKSDADDFGFLIPSPTQPVLDESGNDVFPYLSKLTEPEIKWVHLPASGMGCGCAAAPGAIGTTLDAAHVTVLEQKLVAGFDAAVLEATSVESLVGWLKAHDYAFSPEVQIWARPYVDAGWKITALKVAKDAEAKGRQDVSATALRMSFHTDRPLFPYREPDPRSNAAALHAKHRLLRIYFLADGRYAGELTKESPWTGKVVWSNALSETNRWNLLQRLKLPQTSTPMWLTEFEDDWPYRAAPADVYFSRDPNQAKVKRPPVTEYVRSNWPDDATGYALALVIAVPPLWRRVRRGGASS
jgi:hypothetical protein